ncbi:MAG TPA: hypothetical protein PKI91_13140 [Smithella sp.]|nr:hypothetical protein [Smithella sp.]HNY51510.1 hypothetical protein [Smithella sp.]
MLTKGDYQEIQVECYSGFKANERPVAFTCQGERREIREIVDRWYEGGLDSSRPVMDYFKVRAADGKVYLLRYQSGLDAWSLRL